ncbi:MAG: hypothetical protein HC778_02940 [Chamaesiphon sp. CSU_1_12]|nr:hypothetical protein [Chamaesiphon sp. CSU_1_12]
MVTQQEKIGIFRFYESWLHRVGDYDRESEELSFSSQSCLGYLAPGGIERKALKLGDDSRFSAINGVPPYNQPNGRHGWSEEDIALV